MRAPLAPVAAFLLSGCVSLGPYPDSWAPRAELASGECPSIDGEYWNEGEYLEKSGKEPDWRKSQLVYPLRNPADPPLQIFDRELRDGLAEPYLKVALRRDQARLHVLATRQDGATVSHELAIDASCSDSMIRIWSGFLDEEPFYGRESLSMTRAADGSLLVRRAGWAFANLIIVPAAIIESGWTRYPPVDTAPVPVSWDRQGEME
ncbi:MAG TPA: hypothetical protein VH856_02240 [Steroidobacteraceae bacterium]|jgi:hypothetical protein